MTVALASTVPLKVGVVSLVVAPLAMLPVTGARSSVALKLGAVVVSVKVVELLTGLRLPAASASVALTL